ncbi:EAL domain-containing protein [Sphingomonas sp. Tas61C01]|uniref:EAL domain-containing protein n=1 Tax=Sphingomonas sp. Tas61C01 TaxID=3458297 RepID=UPI00403EC382
MATDVNDMENGIGPPLLIVSFRQRDELAQIAAGAGWHASIYGDNDDLEKRLLDSDAAVALVDARGALDLGLDAVRSLGGVVTATGGALLVMVSRGDVGTIDEFYLAGATHFLASPAGEGELIASLRFAARHAARTGAAIDRREPPSAWQHDGNAGTARRWLATALADPDRPVSVLLLALSRLDLVNAAYGRPAVDALIDAAGRRLRIAVESRIEGRPLAVRISGSEFIVAVEADAEEIEAISAAIDEALARPFPVEQMLAVLGSRVGIATRSPADDAAALLHRASEALAAARASDGMVRTATKAGVAPLDTLAIDLHHAIDRGEIDLRFQPQVEIASGRITGVEALARWDHATLGPLGAETLFAAADRADLGIALSDHIQRLALARAAAWPRALQMLRLSLNLTASDVTRPGFAALFLGRVDESGFPRGRLTVEITETGLIEDLPAAAALFATLRGGGCRVAIDDFGTGYSSLAYLKALPLDYLKIDKTLASEIDQSPRDRIVVRGVIEMAQSLGLPVIAEGVETDAQLELLAAAGCAFYQGFLRAHPLDEAALIALMEEEA